MKKKRVSGRGKKISNNSTSSSSNYASSSASSSESSSAPFGDFAFVSPVKEYSDTFLITLHVKPNAKKNYFKIDSGQLIVSITAPATKGKANKALITLFSQDFHISKSQITIVRGKTSPTKIIQLNITKTELMSRLKSFQ